MQILLLFLFYYILLFNYANLKYPYTMDIFQ